MRHLKEPLNFTPFDTRWVPQSVAGSDDVFTGIKVPGQEDPVTSEYVEQSGYVQFSMIHMDALFFSWARTDSLNLEPMAIGSKQIRPALWSWDNIQGPLDAFAFVNCAAGMHEG